MNHEHSWNTPEGQDGYCSCGAVRGYFKPRIIEDEPKRSRFWTGWLGKVVNL